MEETEREKIFAEIEAERKYQDGKWGTAFDDKNTINDWGSYITNYLGKATTMEADKPTQYKNLLKVATLAVAALETFRRNQGFAPRHYDV